MEKKNFSSKLVATCLLTLQLALSASATRAGKIYFSDDFGAKLTKWDVALDSFQSTDLFYRSPGYCASDSPKGNYPPHANGTMTMKLMHRVDLSKTNDPVLRFWHRIGVYDGDYGYVDISEDFGFNWTVLRFYTNTWRSTWSFEQIDLGAYKASPKPILIRFRLRDNGDAWQTWGWDIDDVEITERDTETIPFPFFDDFESGLGNWKLEAGALWQLTEDANVSPTHCISESPKGNYPASACYDLILAHPIDVSSSAWPVLTFWHRIGVYDADHGYVDVSQDGGTSWRKKPLKDYTNVWLGNWTIEQVDLSEYKASAKPILIRFRLRDNGDAWRTWGWDIDDVHIRELFYYDPSPDSLIVQITEIDDSQCPAIQATVTVADANRAAIAGLDASNFSVYEDNKLRTPIRVETNTAMVHVGLALDYSNSMKRDPKTIPDMEEAAKAFVDLLDVNAPNHWGQVLKFANGLEIAQKFTDDKSALRDAIDRDTELDGGATWLYDAIYQAVSDAAGQPRSKAVIVMTDGKDTKSPPGRSATEVIRHAQAEGVPVFTIGLGSEVDEAVLSTIATQTAGVYYYAPDSNDLREIYWKIAGALKNEYVVTYETAVCQSEDTGYPDHELEILVTDGPAYGQGAKRFRCPASCPRE